MRKPSPIAAVNLTSFTIVINEYSNDATIMHRRAQRLCANLQYVNNVKNTIPRWQPYLRAWSGRIGRLYMFMINTKIRFSLEQARAARYIAGDI